MKYKKNGEINLAGRGEDEQLIQDANAKRDAK